ncbi:hypothetical protein Cus16_1002 [Curtobacterium sp. ER1/6]|nr:hypothetical protein Cus16_1002 [Curtobacterium sp. ER1/6]
MRAELGPVGERTERRVDRLLGGPERRVGAASSGPTVELDVEPVRRAADAPDRARRTDGHPGPGVVHHRSTTSSWPRRRVLGRQDVLTVGLADLVHLGERDRHAVALARVLGEEVLVVLLRTEERPGRLDRRDDAAVPHRAGAVDRPTEQRLLLGVGGEHRGPVLRAHVGTLSVQLPRVVEREEDVEDDVSGDDGLVEGDRDGLGVPGRAGADRLVGRSVGGAADVARHHVLHALERAVHRVETPEAATCEHERRHAQNLPRRARGGP